MDVSAAEFRRDFFQILREMERGRKEVVITKRGKPVARLVSIGDAGTQDALIGGLSGLGRTLGDLTIPAVEDAAWELD